MGLLDRTLKKAGKERVKPQPEKPATEDKAAVSWLGRTFSERTKALADKIDLEAQYAHLETLTKAAELSPPPKTSLRDRAKKFLTGFTTSRATADSASTTSTPERPHLSLRERAKLLMKKFSGGSGGGAAGGVTQGSLTETSTTSTPDSELQPDNEDELLSPQIFPWWQHTEEGDLSPHVAFGEEPHAEYLVAEEPTAPAEEIPEETKSPLSEFAATMERITENLKNLHVQLDTGNIIRDVQVERGTGVTSVATPADGGALISHHVTTGTGEAGNAAEASDQTNLPPQSRAQEPARDVFWPKDLPLDLPARDIKLNADGSISVVPGPFQLPHLAEDIAPADSEISHFTRNLKNAELFIAEGELQLTRIIYERLLVKIIDADARRKIQANLDALQNYKKSHDWGNFMPVPPWMKNPWADLKPPTLNVSEMPVEAKSITINIDKGIFDVARAAFEQEKKAEKESEGGAEEADSGIGADDAAEEEGEEKAERAEESEGAEDEKRAGVDRRKGGADPRGAGAEDRRTGKDRRADDSAGDEGTGEAAADGADAQKSDEQKLPENAPPAPLAADGSAPTTAGAAAPAEEEPPADGVMEKPQMPDMAPDGQASAPGGGDEDGGSGEEKEEENKVQEIRGVLELKTPDQEDTPFLTLTYDFTKIPHAYRLAKDNGIFEYAYYKYKPMLVKAHQFIKRKQITRALNYYRVIREQQIPSEFRHMVDRNIKDITEYLQKYLVTRAN